MPAIETTHTGDTIHVGMKLRNEAILLSWSTLYPGDHSTRPYRYVLAFVPDGHQRFVTWMRCEPINGESCYTMHGHYCDTLAEAVESLADRCTRANLKVSQ